MNLLEANPVETKDISRSVTPNRVRFPDQGTATAGASTEWENTTGYRRNNDRSLIRFEQIPTENYRTPDNTSQVINYERERMGSQDRNQFNFRSPREGWNQPGKQQDKRSNGGCPRCGLDHGLDYTCPAINRSCRNCGKLNHWARCCKDAEATNKRPYRPPSRSEITYDSDPNY